MSDNGRSSIVIMTGAGAIGAYRLGGSMALGDVVVGETVSVRNATVEALSGHGEIMNAFSGGDMDAILGNRIIAIGFNASEDVNVYTGQSRKSNVKRAAVGMAIYQASMEMREAEAIPSNAFLGIAWDTSVQSNAFPLSACDTDAKARVIYRIEQTTNEHGVTMFAPIRYEKAPGVHKNLKNAFPAGAKGEVTRDATALVAPTEPVATMLDKTGIAGLYDQGYLIVAPFAWEAVVREHYLLQVDLMAGRFEEYRARLDAIKARRIANALEQAERKGHTVLSFS